MCGGGNGGGLPSETPKGFAPRAGGCRRSGAHLRPYREEVEIWQRLAVNKTDFFFLSADVRDIRFVKRYFKEEQPF